MSKVTIAGDVNGTGVFTLAAPNGNTNRTLTLPDEAGTMALQGGAGVGKVLQVVSVYGNPNASTTSSTFVASGNKLSITPSSATSKILGHFHCSQINTASAQTEMRVAIYRNGSVNIGEMVTAILPSGQMLTSISMAKLDSPNTTSEVEYEFYIKKAAGSGPVYLQQDYNIVLMEIAA